MMSSQLCAVLLITRLLVWFGRAANQTGDAKVAADARVASREVRRLWVMRAEAADMEAASSMFTGVLQVEAAAAGASEVGGWSGGGELLARWQRGAAAWSAFHRAFESHASFANSASLAALREAMGHFEGALASVGGGAPSDAHAELLRYLLLSRLAE